MGLKMTPILPHERTILSINVGSSSIKSAIFNRDQRVDININYIGLKKQTVKITFKNITTHENKIFSLFIGDDLDLAASTLISLLNTAIRTLDWKKPSIIGHRVKFAGHGADIEKLSPRIEQILEFNDYLSSRHNKLCLSVISHAKSSFKETQQFIVRDQAVSDLSLHTPNEIPFESKIIRRYGLISHGYHGLASKACLRTLEKKYGIPNFTGLLTQIGSGVSVTAIVNGAISYNSMKFAACDGPVMHNRSGSQPLGLVLRMLKYGFPANRLSEAVNRNSGIYGLSDLPSNSTVTVEEILGDEQHKEACDNYLLSIACEIFRLTSKNNDLHHFIFSGGLATRHPWLAPKILQIAKIINPDEADELTRQLKNGSHTASTAFTEIYLVDIDEHEIIRNILLTPKPSPIIFDTTGSICEVAGTTIGKVLHGITPTDYSAISINFADTPFDLKAPPPLAYIFAGTDRSSFFVRASVARSREIPTLFINSIKTAKKLINRSIYLDTPTRTIIEYD